MQLTSLLAFSLLAITFARGEKCRIVDKFTLRCHRCTEKDVRKYLTKHPQVESIFFHESTVRRISHDLLEHLTNLTEFSARGVGIEHVDENAFSGLLYINWIDLSKNKIQNISSQLVTGPLIEQVDVSGNPGLYIPRDAPFLTAGNLEWLKIEACEVTEVYEESFAGMVSLERLSLAQNQLKNLPKNVFKYNSFLSYLDLAGNRIKTLRDTVFFPQRSMDWIIHFENNPWVCDCKLTRLLVWARKMGIEGNTTCEKPKGTLWKDIDDPARCQPLQSDHHYQP